MTCTHVVSDLSNETPNCDVNGLEVQQKMDLVQPTRVTYRSLAIHSDTILKL